MQLYSTKDKSLIVSLKDAVLNALAPNMGLYMPTQIPLIEKKFIQHIEEYSLQDIAFQICKSLMGGYIPDSDLKA